MDMIKLVITTTTNILNTRISFGAFSFTLMSTFLALSVLGILINFIKSIFDF